MANVIDVVMVGSVTRNTQALSRIIILLYLTSWCVPWMWTQTYHPTNPNLYIWRIRFVSMQRLKSLSESPTSSITTRLLLQSLTGDGENTAAQIRTPHTFTSRLRLKVITRVPSVPPRKYFPPAYSPESILTAKASIDAFTESNCSSVTEAVEASEM